MIFGSGNLQSIYYVSGGVLSLSVVAGIYLSGKVLHAKTGNMINSGAALIAVILSLAYYGIITSYEIWISLAAGSLLGLMGAIKIRMTEMPQGVAFLNGIGGLASSFVSWVFISGGMSGALSGGTDLFTLYAACAAFCVGVPTFTGSMIAAARLHKLIPQKQLFIKAHKQLSALMYLLTGILFTAIPYYVFTLKQTTAAAGADLPLILMLAALSVTCGMAGILFAIRIGGADMPLCISFLNSLSGVSGGIAGIAAGNILLTAVGGIVGASGLILTRSMCVAMNRRLKEILIPSGPFASLPAPASGSNVSGDMENSSGSRDAQGIISSFDPAAVIRVAKKVIIVPGYGMAQAQAQSLVRELLDKLEQNGAEVIFAIHPVAGRMPGHMNVLLCDADIPYEKLRDMESINPEFKNCDVVIIIGANDVVNPSANTAKGTPIYGMPVLEVTAAKHILICNYDSKPGYAGVDNPLYRMTDKAVLFEGDAKESIGKLIRMLDVNN
ncbi:MAG: NAD(P)(+) transhydrogenase (Re/Si-specific) subunit beta [Eubacteriales bacterium]|nr:NAD(P)(+) transhydrogenase (Re/Si-specific) subunit beta [Eubacteriales bacterium]